MARSVSLETYFVVTKVCSDVSRRLVIPAWRTTGSTVVWLMRGELQDPLQLSLLTATVWIE